MSWQQRTGSEEGEEKRELGTRGLLEQVQTYRLHVMQTQRCARWLTRSAGRRTLTAQDRATECLVPSIVVGMTRGLGSAHKARTASENAP